jgi:hypothetical protein
MPDHRRFRSATMKQPILFKGLLNTWMMMPNLMNEGIQKGFVSREPKADMVPLKGLSPISDLRPPEAYAISGWAEVHNTVVRKFRKREAFCAFLSGMSKSELEARLETYALLMTAMISSQKIEPTTSFL